MDFSPRDWSKRLTKYINVKNKTITFKDKSAASTSSDLQNSGKEEKEKQIRGAPPFMSDLTSSAHTAKGCHCCIRNLYCLFHLDFTLSLHKNRDNGDYSPVPVHPPSTPSSILHITGRVTTQIFLASCYSFAQKSSGSHPLAWLSQQLTYLNQPGLPLFFPPFKPGSLLSRPSYKPTKCIRIWNHRCHFLHLKWTAYWNPTPFFLRFTLSLWPPQPMHSHESLLLLTPAFDSPILICMTDHLTPVVFKGRRFCIPGEVETRQWLETVLVVITGEGCYWHPAAWGQGCC